jgi:hypothetical protein
MAIRATGRFALLHYDPGNPQFPTLPDGVNVPHVTVFGRGAGLAARAPVRSGRVLSSAPADESQQFAGWQTDTTWVNPAIIDFGVIPSPVQRTVSLYNARSYPIEVTALSLPSGVTVISPSLPVTLQPYAGDTFTLEAGTTGDNQFDSNESFTTSEGIVPVRMIGRRVFTLNVIPETPMRETLSWKTDLIRSEDGTEKSYSLLQSPNTKVEYNVKFREDLERIRFRNRFIAGESALVVAGQKWYETRYLRDAAQSTDTSLNVSTLLNWSVAIEDSISVVSQSGTAVSAVVNSLTFAPDANYTDVVFHSHFEGLQGAEELTEISTLGNELRFWGGSPPSAYIDTTQSKFGGSSLYFSSGNLRGVWITNSYPDVQVTTEDFTIECWVRPEAYGGCVISQYRALGSPSTPSFRGWHLDILSDRLRFTGNFGGSKYFDRFYNSPRDIPLNEWTHIVVQRSGGDTMRFFVNGVQFGASDPTWNITLESGDRDMIIGAYQESGYVAPYQGWIDELRMTKGLARYAGDFTPPTEPYPSEEDTYLQVGLAAEIGTAFEAGSFVMPIGLGYVSKFPSYSTHRKNLEEASYDLVFNQETDFGNWDTDYFPGLTDLQSPANTLPIIAPCNEVSGKAKSSQLRRIEDALDSGLSNRLAFSQFPFGDEISDYQITLQSANDIWIWRTFLGYLKGSHNEFWMPTFTDDIPGVVTADSNVFTAEDTDLALLFGNPPDPRRNAIRLKYSDGTILYRMITQVIDNVTTEDITLDLAVQAGQPEISYLQRCRILGDTATFTHMRNDYAMLKFKFRTILK